MTQMNTVTPVSTTTVPATQTSSKVTTGQATLYVGDLLPQVTESMLVSIFGREFLVLSVKVCRDAITSRSLGYAYVNFHSSEEAQKAMECFNFTVIAGKPCRIMLAQRDPSLRKSGRGNIFVKNLDKGLDVKTLYNSFSVLGKILSFKLATDEAGDSKGFGFVHYEDESVVPKAIECINGKKFRGKSLYVNYFMSRRERVSENSPAKFNNIFVKNFEDSLTDDKFQELFSPFGIIISAKIMRGEDGSSKRFGFVSFQNFEDAENAVSTMNGKQLTPDLKLFVGRAMKKSERLLMLKAYYEKRKQERALKYQNCNLYVKNLVETIDDQRLIKEFEPFGKITSAIVMKDEKGSSKGFGFVCFEVASEAETAMTKMNDSVLDGKAIYVGIAELKEARQNNLMARYARMSNITASQIYGGSGFMYPMRPQRIPMAQYAPGTAPPMGMQTYAMGAVMAGPRRPPHMMSFERYPVPAQIPAHLYRQRAPAANPRMNSGPNGVYQPNQAFRRPVGTYVSSQSSQNAMYHPRAPSMRPGGMDHVYRGGPPMYRTPGAHAHQAFREESAMSTSVSSKHSIKQNSAQSKQVTSAARPSDDSATSGVQSSSSVDGSAYPFLHEIDVRELKNMDMESRKQILGTAVYKLATTMFPVQASKIAGILLASDVDLISIIKDANALRSEINNVYSALVNSTKDDGSK